MVRLDRNTFESLYYRYGQRLSAYARKFLGDGRSAEDAIHDVFVRFWEKYQGKTSESWVPVLFSMVRNRCIDSLRHLALKRSLTVPGVSMGRNEEILFNQTLSCGAADDSLLLDEMDRRIKAVADSLTPRCRQIFDMSRVEGLKNSEIAARLGISEKAVEKNITTALRVFREKLLETV